MHDARGLAEPATQLHHIAKIRDAPHLRLRTENTLAVCEACHKEVEGLNAMELADFMAAIEVEE